MERHTFSEDTTETLRRVGMGEETTEKARTDAARELAAAWSDPADERNYLKRPAKRTCLHCGETYVSRLSVLAGSPFCSDVCRKATEKLARDLGFSS